jgi:hypothetical protein
MDGPTKNQETPGVSKGTPFQGAEEAKHKGHRISFKSFKELLCSIPFLGGLFKRLFNRRVEIVDPKTSIEERLSSLVGNTKRKSSTFN